MLGNPVDYLVAGVGAVALLALFMAAFLWRRMIKFQKAYVALEKFMSGLSLDELLATNLKQTDALKAEISRHAGRLGKLEEKARKSKDNLELVRFNSSGKMGGDLSFALTFLDQEGSGILLTSIQTVEECRVYIRSIEGGKGKSRLLPEEEQAVGKALGGARV
ncbi:MAG: DUF4446 family protein [Gracilibacteraceae bacterium]|jgi:hypothetical protein|nr:DUF4446 family protein [Gracilibacteraceae bacterium]